MKRIIQTGGRWCCTLSVLKDTLEGLGFQIILNFTLEKEGQKVIARVEVPFSDVTAEQNVNTL